MPVDLLHCSTRGWGGVHLVPVDLLHCSRPFEVEFAVMEAHIRAQQVTRDIRHLPHTN